MPAMVLLKMIRLGALSVDDDPHHAGENAGCEGLRTIIMQNCYGNHQSTNLRWHGDSKRDDVP
jgi:hypothetical protein